MCYKVLCNMFVKNLKKWSGKNLGWVIFKEMRRCPGTTLLKKGLLYKYFSWIYPSLQDSFPVRKLWKTVFINVHTWIYFIEYGNRFGNPLTNSYMTRTFLSNRLKIFLVFRTIFHEEICVQAVSHCEKINFSSRFL